ncbi:MAG: hypothetical protein FWE37_07995 [Spirochaetaceae bacterium]|nr:hypothetical protein [Spirochaetaceae bacterium]
MDYLAVVTPIIEGLGFKVVELSHSPVKGGLKFMLYIYKQNGVSLDDCAKVSLACAARLQALMPAGGEALLEVSSPGLNRVFKDVHEYAIFKGKEVQLNLKTGETALGIIGESNEVGVYVNANLYEYAAIAKAKLRG